MGYTLRTVREEVEKGSHLLKEEMVLAIMKLVADKDEDDHEQRTSTEWVSLVDQGGLWHITNETFSSFGPLKRSFTFTSQFQPSTNFHLV